MSINADPVLGALREEARSKVNRSSSGRITSDWLDNAQWDKVYHVHDEASALSTYTVPVSNSNPSVLDLLVINIIDESSNYGVFSLIADEEWLNGRGSFTGMSDFTGQVEVTDLDGKVWISSPYENGQRVITGSTSNGKTAACETWIDVVWTEVCIEGNCSISEIEIIEYEVCTADSPGGGTPLGPIGPAGGTDGEGGGSGNSGGPGNGPIGFEGPTICSEGQEIYNGSCVDKCPPDHIRNESGVCVQVNALDETTNPDCLELTSSQTDKLGNVLNEYLSSPFLTSCLNQQVYNYVTSNDKKLCFKMGNPSGNPGGYSPSEETIYFNDESNINETTFGEEFFHSYQHEFYGSLPTSLGRSNIEFEAKLYHDLSHGGQCCIAIQHPDIFPEYFIWIGEISNDFTRMPSWNDIEQKYYYFVEKFIEYKPEYDFPIDYDAKPLALFNINNCQ